MELFFTSYFLPCFWAFLASVGFGLVFNILGRGVLICGFGGGIGWFAYLLTLDIFQSDIVGAFVSAAVIGIYSEIMARIRRCPATGYLQVALLPLVPGAGVYHAMQHCLAGESDLFLDTLLHTLGFAAAISVGAMLATSVLRAVLPRIQAHMR